MWMRSGQVISLPRNRLIFLLLFLCFIGGYLFTVLNYRPRVKLGENYIFCNPNAKIKQRKTYHLRLWDTNWPIKEHGDYQSYLERLIGDFQQKYPNIQVEVTLLDLFEGPNQLKNALKTNSAPDVYCSAYSIPTFDYQRQIPVGFYLKRDQKEAYFPEALKLTKLHGIECYFPHWLTPTIWIGNQYFSDNLDFAGSRMGKKSLSLADLQNISRKLPRDKFLWVGNLGHNGFFTDLAVNIAANNQMADSTVEPGIETPFLSKWGISQSLLILNDLITREKVPPDVESNMIGRFLKGNSVMLAGVRPLIYRFLKMRLTGVPAEQVCEPVIMPSLVLGQKKYTLTENGVICIYRNKMTTGDDHLAAAVKLGQFISTYESTGPFQEMMMLPAAKRSAAKWRKELRKTSGDLDILINAVESTTLLNLPDCSTYQTYIYPVLKDFCAQKISLENAEAKLSDSKW
jgi:hypothetical protein